MSGYELSKRALDVLGAGVGLTISAPLLAASALAVRLEDGGPVFFRQERVGQDGRLFEVMKFRSLKPLDSVEASMVWSIANNSRMGPVGRFLRKTSLDELPQLFNVIRGEMSLVGPRPTSLNLATYEPWHERRLDVRPGVTGLWQVRGRNAMTFDERVKLDLEYIDHLSLANDLKLLGQTVLVVVRGKGA